MLRWLRMFQAQSSKAVKLPHYDLTTINSESLFRPGYKLPSPTSWQKWETELKYGELFFNKRNVWNRIFWYYSRCKLMPCLYTNENHSYFYAPIITKKAQARGIPGLLMPVVCLIQRQCVPSSGMFLLQFSSPLPPASRERAKTIA